MESLPCVALSLYTVQAWNSSAQFMLPWKPEYESRKADSSRGSHAHLCEEAMCPCLRLPLRLCLHLSSLFLCLLWLPTFLADKNSASETRRGGKKKGERREAGRGRREELLWGPHSEKQAEVSSKNFKALRQDIECSCSSLPHPTTGPSAGVPYSAIQCYVQTYLQSCLGLGMYPG